MPRDDGTPTTEELIAKEEQECEGCQYGPVETKEYVNNRYFPKRPEEKKKLCLLCASTMAGNALDYPELYREQADILFAICYVGNAILAEIRKGRA